MAKTKVKNNSLVFTELERLGVKNFATFNNKVWGGMSIKKENMNKYKKLFSEKEVVFMFPDHNDNVQLITKENLINYRLFNKQDISDEDLTILGIRTDSIITKESIPIFVTPADCSIIVLTGVDAKDNKSFISSIHAGVWGTILGVHSKTLDLILHFYNVEVSDINAFLFPGVSYKHYKKNIKTDARAKLLTDKEWEGFIYPEEEVFGIDVEGKIIRDLKKAGITKISNTGLDTYEENDEGNLFSFTYIKEHKLDVNNFGVGISLLD